jgi:predicted O-methyltransferase YrrM
MSADLQKIHDEARKNDIPVMLDDGMDFLLTFLKEHEEIRDILEIGTAVGYSSIRMAQIRWDMKIDSLEIDPEMEKQAVRNVEDAGLSDRISLYLIDGADFETETIYDLIFVDAAKSQYRRYLEHFWKNSRKGTWFLFDNLNFHGMVDDDSLTDNRSTRQMVHKIHKFRDHLLKDQRFDTVFHADRGDGIAVSRRIQ